MGLAVFSAGLFIGILWFGGLETWRTVLAGDPRLYLVVFLLTGVTPWLSAWRFRTLVRAATGADVASWRRFFHINMTAIALGIFLPRNAALLGGKAAYLRTLGVPMLRASWAVIMENLVDLVFLTGIGVSCGPVFLFDAGSGVFLATNAVCVAFFIGVVIWARGRNWRALVGSWVAKVPFVASRIPTPEDGFVPGPVRAAPMLAITVLIHLAMALRAYIIALAIGLEPSWLLFAAAYPLTQIGLVLAVAPGALGTFDASWLGLLILGGMSNTDALSFTVALRACIVAFPIAWYGISALIALTIPSAPSASPTEVAEEAR